MRTTLDLPDELMRAVKIRAANERRKLKDVMAELLRRGLAEESGPCARLPGGYSSRSSNASGRNREGR